VVRVVCKPHVLLGPTVECAERQLGNSGPILLCCRFTTRVTGTHTGTLKFNGKEYEATGKTVEVNAVSSHADLHSHFEPPN
jgi:hypothetical protein